MKTNFFLWTFLISLSFFSCSDDGDDGNNDQNGTFNPADVECLVKMVSGGGTYEWGSYNWSTTVEYNDDFLVTKMTDSQEEEDEGETYSSLSISTYTYDNQNRPSSMIKEEDGELEEKEEYIFSDGKLEIIEYKYSGESWMPYYKKVHDLDGNGNVIKIVEYDYNNGTWEMDDDYATFTWNIGNVTKMAYYEEESMPGAPVYKSRAFKNKHFNISNARFKSVDAAIKGYEATYTYTDKTNPFYYFSLKQTMWPVEEEGPSFTKNLLLSASGSDSDGDMDATDYSYEYNNKGLPTMMISNYSYQYTEEGTQYTETGIDTMHITYICE